MITITIEGQSYRLPTSLMDITLQERIEFDKAYGKKLREQLKKIIDMKDGIDKEMDFSTYHMELACKSLAFFGDIPLDIVENTKMQQVLAVYHSTTRMMAEDTDFSNTEVELIREVEWNGETWVIAPPELKNESLMSFGEFIDAKQSVKDLYELGNEKWEALLSLCCVYLRKKGEAYDDELITDEGPRKQLMKTLPLQYALHVGFFLSVSLTSWLQTYRSLSQAENLAALN